MSRIHRFLATLLPPPGDEWVQAHELELAHIEEGHRAWRLGVVRLAGAALAHTLRHDPRSLLEGPLMKTAVTTLSIVNTTAGLALAVLYVSGEQPGTVLALALVLLVQGGYTLALLRGVFSAREGAARTLQVVGSTLAVAAGSIAAIVGAADAIGRGGGGDPEFGPMAVAMLIAAHGVASLMSFAGRAAPRMSPTDVPRQ